MEPKFQSSFIPKNPVVSSPSSKVDTVKETSIFSIIATVVFLITALSSGGLYFYKVVIEKQIEEADANINTARQTFQVDKIEELISSNNKIAAARTLLEGHVMASKVIVLLQALTLRNLAFKNFEYKNRGGSPSISMQGEAQSYNALAKQQEIFLGSEFVRNPQFSDIVLNDKGNVNFTFVTELLPDLVSYKKSVDPTPLPVTETTQ